MLNTLGIPLKYEVNDHFTLMLCVLNVFFFFFISLKFTENIIDAHTETHTVVVQLNKFKDQVMTHQFLKLLILENTRVPKYQKPIILHPQPNPVMAL